MLEVRKAKIEDAEQIVAVMKNAEESFEDEYYMAKII